MVHPLVVHFPMALLISGTLFRLMGKIQKEEVISETGNFNLIFGFWTLPPAFLIGFIGKSEITIKPTFESFIELHILYSSLAFVIFAGIIFLNRLPKNRFSSIVHYLLCIFGLAAILATGFFGGELVHKFDLPNSSVI